ncbi:unnamed protein product [Mycena citricolor]|uniref:Uncharacterized protein n=1 Tax=Mycena citricolor TaxID=2018698 RepID=A0AAD2GY81_9AGAR|nr:unnamed protein product [Mycena citricolor]CAK5279818.1 unnamed protein product [Mycena citricolor]
MPEQSQYSQAARMPLIKSPSLRIPRPVTLPPDIHPLPESIAPYMVYPFTLEPHIITLESSRQATVAAHDARRDAYLKSRADEKDRRKRDALRRIAPGFEPGEGHVLVPTKRSSLVGSPPPVSAAPTPPAPPKSVMDDLVDRLAAMDSEAESRSARP